MPYALFGLGFFFGFILWEFFAGKHTGDKAERSLRFKTKNHYVHLHHWVLALGILLILFLLRYRDPFIFGFLAGSIAQGLTYRDRFRIFYPKE